MLIWLFIVLAFGAVHHALSSCQGQRIGPNLLMALFLFQGSGDRANILMALFLLPGSEDRANTLPMVGSAEQPPSGTLGFSGSSWSLN